MRIIWIRTCQECGHKHKYNKEPNYQRSPEGLCVDTDPLFSVPCSKCKSEALDYGSYQENSTNSSLGN